MNTSVLIEELKTAAQTSSSPVARTLHKGNAAKATVLVFRSGAVLREHQSSVPATLFVVEGKVLYREDGQETTLSTHEHTAIPPQRTHVVEAITDSVCLLIQG